MTNNEYLEVIRSLIDRETTLLNNRLSWFLTSQSLLAAACGVFWDKKYAIAVVLYLGISSAAASIPGLHLCSLAINFYRAKTAPNETDPPVDYDHAKEVGNEWWLKFVPWKSLPVVFLIGWIALGVIKFLNL